MSYVGDGSINSESRPLVGGDFPLERPATGVMAALKKATAFFTLFMMIMSWIMEGEVIQKVQGPASDGGPGFENNFFITYCTRLGWTTILIGWYAWKVCFYPNKTVPFKVGNTWYRELPPAEGAFTWKTYTIWGIFLGVAIFISSYTWYFSLAGTSVAGNSAVYQSAPVFVFLLSLALGEEQVTFLKSFAVLACVGGSAMVAFLGQTDPNSMTIGTLYTATSISTKKFIESTNSSASGGNWSMLHGKHNATGCKTACHALDQCNAFSVAEATEACALYTCKAACSAVNTTGSVAELLRGAEAENTIGGYAWCLISVIFYAGYEVVYGKYVSNSDDPFKIANSQRFFGPAGLMTLLVVWPMFFILNATHVEEFAWPSSEQWKWIWVAVLCDTSFNLFLVLTIVLTNPLFTSVGTILVIPISTLVDYLLNGTLLPPAAFGGVGLIVVGFSAIVYAEHKDHQAKGNH